MGNGPCMWIRSTARRFLAADGTSHVRALAYQSAFVMMAGFIGLVGLASVLDLGQLRTIVQELASSVAPGAAGRLLQEAIRQGSGDGPLPAVIGLGAALTSGTFAMAQLQRSANRLHGIETDDPPARRYGQALALAASAGVLLAIGGLMLGGGRSVATGFDWHGSAATTWEILRWPLGLSVAGAAIGLMFTVTSPDRRPAHDLASATGIALALWATFTLMLGAYLSISSSTRNIYGPLLSVVAMLLWAAATSLALHLGLAVLADRRGTDAATPLRRVRLPDSAEIHTSARR